MSCSVIKSTKRNRNEDIRRTTSPECTACFGVMDPGFSFQKPRKHFIFRSQFSSVVNSYRSLLEYLLWMLGFDMWAIICPHRGVRKKVKTTNWMRAKWDLNETHQKGIIKRRVKIISLRIWIQNHSIMGKHLCTFYPLCLTRNLVDVKQQVCVCVNVWQRHWLNDISHTHARTCTHALRHFK